MRVALFLATVLLTTPAMAQYQPQPDLSGALDRARNAILNTVPQQPSYDVRPGPLGDYSVTPRPGYGGQSVYCRPGPLGGYNCQ